MLDLAPRTRNRLTGWTPARRAAFLEALAETGSAERAAVRVGLSASSVFRLRRQPRGAAFALAWDGVLNERRARLADAVMARISEKREPVFYRGRVIGERVVASNRLLLSVLARTFADRRARHEADIDRAGLSAHAR